MSNPPNSLADALESLIVEPPQKRGPVCTIGGVLARLAVADPAAVTGLNNVLENPAVSSSRIAAVLGEHGESVLAATVARHRRRGDPNGCRCPR